MEGKDQGSKHKQRLKGLFGKEKKVSSLDEVVDDFLHGSDKLNFPAPTPNSSPLPPQLTRIDTQSASRWPTAAEIKNSTLARGRSASPKRQRRGLVVRFADERPEIIGEGGDEAELPTAEIAVSLRNRAHSHPPSRYQRSANSRDAQPFVGEQHPGGTVGDVQIRPGPIRRTQTGFESVSDNTKSHLQSEYANVQRSSELHSPNSFATRVQAEMQAGEGEALVRGVSSSIEPNVARSELAVRSEGNPNSAVDEVQRNTLNNTFIPPSGLPSQLIPGRVPTPEGLDQLQPESGDIEVSKSRSPASTTVANGSVPLLSMSTSDEIMKSPRNLSRSSSPVLHEATPTSGHDSFQHFSTRIAHLFTLFRLSAESIRPLSKGSLEEYIRAALWWLLYGRLNLEATIRDRPASPEAQRISFTHRQQAYADLAKSLWLIEKVLPQYHDFPNNQTTGDAAMIEFLEIRQGIISNLRKLTISMERNNLLPPEDAPLTQGLDTSIWVPENGNRSLLVGQKQDSSITTSFSMPLGDTSQWFQYGRLFAKGILKEIGSSQDYQSLLMVTIVRDLEETGLSMVITSQSGGLKLCVKADTAGGPTWEDVEWHARTPSIEVRLPRGFTIQLQCTPHDFKALFAIYDYQKKIHSDFKQKRDERLLFESSLRFFQYFDGDGNSNFPKEPISQCKLRVFEKLVVEKTATLARSMHGGFRACLITSRRSRVLRGVNQEFPPGLPIQFGFLRGESGLPAFLLKNDDGKLKYTMVFTFEDPRERSQLHTRLTGVSIRGKGTVLAEAMIQSFDIANPEVETFDCKCLKNLHWQSVRVLSDDQEDPERTKNVFSENLRVVMDFHIGSITDRFNIGPGDLKLRLDVTSSNELKVLRQRQQDMTVSILESQVSKELPHELAELLSAIAKGETIRTYKFPNLKDLHLFQAALTGFSIIFDGTAASFSISRRRMVVPIYKKWDAVTTRVQLVQRERVVQLVAFFENFSHGDCMNFILKSTDIFESYSKNGKFYLRIVDAKFALPKGDDDGERGLDKGYVCLDMLEYPGEHDDITIVFDTEPGTFSTLTLKILVLMTDFMQKERTLRRRYQRQSRELHVCHQYDGRRAWGALA